MQNKHHVSTTKLRIWQFIQFTCCQHFSFCPTELQCDWMHWSVRVEVHKIQHLSKQRWKECVVILFVACHPECQFSMWSHVAHENVRNYGMAIPFSSGFGVHRFYWSGQCRSPHVHVRDPKMTSKAKGVNKAGLADFCIAKPEAVEYYKSIQPCGVAGRCIRRPYWQLHFFASCILYTAHNFLPISLGCHPGSVDDNCLLVQNGTIAVSSTLTITSGLALNSRTSNMGDAELTCCEEKIASKYSCYWLEILK